MSLGRFAINESHPVSDKLIPIGQPLLGAEEINSVVDVLKSGRLREGTKCREFEEMFAQKVGAKYAVATSSGTAALHIAYLTLLQGGEEVIVPSFTFIATASMVFFAGGNPVFCDIDSRTFTMDIGDLKRRITPKTKVIAPVHLFGNACDVKQIMEIARDNNLRIIWDAAQALGTTYDGKDIGCFDEMVCYSFYPSKNITTGEGGMIVTNDRELYEKCRLLRSHGQAAKYQHTLLGLNYRMTDIQAAIGVEQTKKMDAFITKRRENARYLTAALSGMDGITPPWVKSDAGHTYNQYSILLNLDRFKDDRDAFVAALGKENIGAAVHYPIPLHKQPAFIKLVGDLTLPVSEDVSKRILSLPVHPHLGKRELDLIVQAVKKVHSFMIAEK